MIRKITESVEVTSLIGNLHFSEIRKCKDDKALKPQLDEKSDATNWPTTHD